MALPVLVLGVVVVATIWWAGTSARRGGVTGDPASTDPDGARAAVLLLEQAGLDVAAGPIPESGTGTVIVLNRRFSAGAEEELDAYVAAGGTAVIAAGAGRAPANGSARVNGSVAAGCPEQAGFEDVAELRLGTVSTLDGRDAASACFPLGDGHLVIVDPERGGTRVSVGSVEPFLNRSIDEADNGVLAVRLAQLADGPVTVLDRPAVAAGGGSRTLADLLPGWFWAFVLQGSVAVLAFVLWKGMRFGRPVEERQPVQIEANALVEATGRLLGRSRHPAAAAELIARRFRDDLVTLAGLPPDCDDGALLDSLAVEPRLRETLAEAIGPVPADLDRAGMVRRSTAVAAAREAIRAGPASRGEPTGDPVTTEEDGEWSTT